MPLLLSGVLECFGMPKDDVKIFEADKSGYLPTPAPGFEYMDESHRVHYSQRKEFATYLQGRHLHSMTDNFARKLSCLLQADQTITSEGWTYVPDLYEFIRRSLFHASVESTCGEHLFPLCPTLYEDYCAYEAAFSTLVKGFPRWLAPRAHESRRRMHDNLSRWQAHSDEKYDWNTDDHDVDYEPYFGSSLMRAMQRRYRSSGFSSTGKAANVLGFLIA